MLESSLFDRILWFGHWPAVLGGAASRIHHYLLHISHPLPTLQLLHQEFIPYPNKSSSQPAAPAARSPETEMDPPIDSTVINKDLTTKTAAPKSSLRPLITITPPDVKIKHTPGRGYGLIVTRAFRAGELIFTERPLILANHVDGQELQESIANALYATCSDSLAKFYKLYNPLKLWSYWDDAHHGKFSTLEENIWNSNRLAFGQDPMDPGKRKSAVFELASRINHSCLCNAEWDWNYNGFLALYAWTDLKAGDEITIDYLGLPAWEMTAKERRLELARDYNFLCRCEACDNELGYWDILERKEQKVFRRFLDEESCYMEDTRGPENYHCAEPGCHLSNNSDTRPLDHEVENFSWEYCWEYDVSVSPC